uniref:Uncharacterized protein n=1 Tax=Ixodes ricinus TaxID=34613 RepID=A0A6B0VDG6_IXORI
MFPAGVVLEITGGLHFSTASCIFLNAGGELSPFCNYLPRPRRLRRGNARVQRSRGAPRSGLHRPVLDCDGLQGDVAGTGGCRHLARDDLGALRHRRGRGQCSLGWLGGPPCLLRDGRELEPRVDGVAGVRGGRLRGNFLHLLQDAELALELSHNALDLPQLLLLLGVPEASVEFSVDLVQHLLLVAQLLLYGGRRLGQVEGLARRVRVDLPRVLFKLHVLEENGRVRKECVQHPVADLHTGAQNNGHVLEVHLVVLLHADDVGHVHKHPGEQQPVRVRQLLYQPLNGFHALCFVFYAGRLLKLGAQLAGEHGVWQLPEELLQQARHDMRLVLAETQRLVAVAAGSQLLNLGFDPRHPVDALARHAMFFDVVDALPHERRKLHAIVRRVPLQSGQQGHAEDGVFGLFVLVLLLLLAELHQALFLFLGISVRVLLGFLGVLGFGSVLAVFALQRLLFLFFARKLEWCLTFFTLALGLIHLSIRTFPFKSNIAFVFLFFLVF